MTYIDEHGLPRHEDGSVDHEEWRLVEIEEKLERQRFSIKMHDDIDRAHTRIGIEERARWRAMPWWRQLWEGIRL